MVKLIVTDIHITYTVHYCRHNLHSHCIGSHFLFSREIQRRCLLSSSGTIFDTLDAKYRREFKPK